MRVAIALRPCPNAKAAGANAACQKDNRHIGNAACQRDNRHIGNAACQKDNRHIVLSLPLRLANAKASCGHLASACVLSAALLSLSCIPANAESLYGPARAVDGDTLVVQDTKIRLFGVDAPEKGQLCKNARGQDYPCGVVSTEALKVQVSKGPVKCDVKTKDQYGRSVASCTLATGQDVGDFMVQNGLAVAYRQYSIKYVAGEEQARAAHKGIWEGAFEMPAEWRKRNKGQGAGPATMVGGASPGINVPPPALLPPPVLPSNVGPPPGCSIKGNISSSGERVYHMPGGAYYEQTKIDLSDGERWFCSEREAEAAGWRKSLR